MFAKSVATAAIAVGCVGLGTGVAQAMPSDIAGDHISWNSQLPCSDGGSVYVNTAPKYLTTGGGYYETRLALYTNDGARLAINPLSSYHVTASTWLQIPRWTVSSSYAGEAYVTAFAYKWNGSSYVLVARESLGCL